MKFIANALNGEFMSNILPAMDDEVDGVLASIAYGSNFNDEKNDFLGHCIANRYRLDIWMRYDHTVPVAIPLLKRFLHHHKDNIFCKLVPDVLHSKVIWWRPQGRSPIEFTKRMRHRPYVIEYIFKEVSGAESN